MTMGCFQLVDISEKTSSWNFELTFSPSKDAYSRPISTTMRVMAQARLIDSLDSLMGEFVQSDRVQKGEIAEIVHSFSCGRET